MLKTTEATDIKHVLKPFSKLGYATENALDTDIDFISGQTELFFRDMIGDSYYDFLKGLNGSYTDIYQKSTYYAEVYAIARDMMNHVASKNKSNSSGQSISIPGFSRSNGGGTEWFLNDRQSFNNEYIKFMYNAGFKVNQVRQRICQKGVDYDFKTEKR